VKVIEKDILPFQENDYFSPLRDKIDYAKLLVISARNLLLDYDAGGMPITCRMKLVIDKMNRLFFHKENKYFSVSFPFSTLLDEDNKVIEINSYSGKRVDFQSISGVISVLESEQFRLNPSPIGYYMNSNGVDSIGLELLEEIFRFEPSYIRYDYDPANENGRLHPLYHMDINYSTYGTFKLGLNNEINLAYLENLLNTNTDCAYIID
jgi:hypothetical protein